MQFSSIFTANIEKEEHLNDDTYYFIVYITHVSKITFADFILKMKYNIIINIYITNWIGGNELIIFLNRSYYADLIIGNCNNSSLALQ